MFRNEKQQCEAIQLLLKSLHMERFWSDKGPTKQACKYLEGSPLSSGEQIFLRCAFDLWNGDGKVLLWQDLLGSLDTTRTELLFTLVIAVNRGGDAVQKWIDGRKSALTCAACGQDTDRLMTVKHRGEDVSDLCSDCAVLFSC